MKIGRYRGADGAEREGVVTGAAGAHKVLDLMSAAAAHGHSEFAHDMDAFIDGGPAMLQAAHADARRAKPGRGGQMVRRGRSGRPARQLHGRLLPA